MIRRTLADIENDILEGRKYCNRCGERKLFSEFHQQKASRDGCMSWCKSCNNMQRRKWEKENPNYGRRKHLKAKYDITPEHYDTMLEEQGGVCAICETDKPGGPWEKFKVDHDHKTGKVRGLLCQHCNVGLGHFNDSPDLLATAIDYLNENWPRH